VADSCIIVVLAPCGQSGNFRIHSRKPIHVTRSTRFFGVRVLKVKVRLSLCF